MTPAAAPILPWFIAVPAAGVVMVFILLHLRSLSAAAIPTSRRRLRTAGAVAMLFAAPLLAFAVGATTPDQPRVMAMAWLAVIVLMGLIMFIAGLDMLNNLRLFAQQRRALRDEVALALREPVRPGANPHTLEAAEPGQPGQPGQLVQHPHRDAAQPPRGDA